MTTTTLRIKQVLYEKLIKLAENDKRSINQEIQYIIERYIEMMTWQLKR